MKIRAVSSFTETMAKEPAKKTKKGGDKRVPAAGASAASSSASVSLSVTAPTSKKPKRKAKNKGTRKNAPGVRRVDVNVDGLTFSMSATNSRFDDVDGLRESEVGDNGTVHENKMIIKAKGVAVHGNECRVDGHNCTVHGNKCDVYGDHAKVYGDDCRIWGNHGIVYGNNALIKGAVKEVLGNNPKLVGGSIAIMRGGNMSMNFSGIGRNFNPTATASMTFNNMGSFSGQQGCFFNNW